MSNVILWRRFAVVLWLAAVGCFAGGWAADKPHVQKATAPLVVCCIVAAARARSMRQAVESRRDLQA